MKTVVESFETVALRTHLEANNGIKGLELLQPHEVDRAVKLFQRDGFVVVTNVLNEEQTRFLANGCSEVAAQILA